MIARRNICLAAILIFFIIMLCCTRIRHSYPHQLQKRNQYSPHHTRISLNSNQMRYETAHFVYGLWDTSPMPIEFRQNMEKWKKQGWIVKLWDKPMVDELLLKYPEYSKVVSTFKRKVQIADLARLLILFDEGGH